jgi:hypothetical protein
MIWHPFDRETAPKDRPIAILIHSIPAHYLPADGRCLDMARYSELANALHDGDNWPWGKCDDGHGFRLPDLRGFRWVGLDLREQVTTLIRVE